MAAEEQDIAAPQPLGTSATLVAVRGEVTFANADALTRALDAALATGRPRLVVDISEVPFMDSSGISALLSASLQAGREGRTVAVVHAGEEPPGIFRFKGVERLLQLYPSRDAAADGPEPG
jgi:anti-anti-sigma factor